MYRYLDRDRSANDVAKLQKKLIYAMLGPIQTVLKQRNLSKQGLYTPYLV